MKLSLFSHDLVLCCFKLFFNKRSCFCCSFNIKKEPRDSPLRLIAYRFRGDMVEAGNSAADVRDRMRGISEHESTYLWFMATGKGS